MICSICNGENADTNQFCILCGAALRVEPFKETSGDKPSIESQDEEISLSALREQLRELQLQVSQIRTTLSRHGMPVVLRQPEQERQRAAPPVARSAMAASAAAPPVGRPPGATPPPPDEPQGPRPWGRIQMDWELVLGGNWMARIGILAVIIGMGFFLKLAFDNNWIGETGRVALGIVAGIAFLGAGEYWQRRYPAWAQALTGGGIRRRLVFSADPEQSYSLYYGNTKARRPSYDFERLYPYLETEGIQQASLGAQVDSVLAEKEQPPVSERLSWLLPVVVVVAAIAVGLILLGVVRQALKSLPPPADK